MTFRSVIDLLELLDDGRTTGAQVAEYLSALGTSKVSVKRVEGDKPGTFTDFIRCEIAGSRGKMSGGSAPTLGIIGRLGGVGARPARKGFVSDGDGALAALAAAAKLIKMQPRGDRLEGDVIVTTQVCENAPTRPHEPVPFMSSCVDQYVKNRYEVDPAMDAILSVDTTKGNRIINKRGFALSPTVKEGCILRMSEDLLSLMSVTTGKLPAAFPLTQQDITPYGNGLYHMNSILQPSVAAHVPVVGIAITTETVVPGCGTGATHLVDVDDAVRYSIEVAKAFTQNECSFYDKKEFELITKLYGSMTHFQGSGQH